MSDSFDNAKCVICSAKAVIQWPFIDGKPAFCREHSDMEYTEPYGVWPSEKDKSDGETKKDSKRPVAKGRSHKAQQG